MKTNNLRDRFSGQDILVCALQIVPHPRISAEIAAAGFDFVIVDLEHGDAPDDTVKNITRIIDLETAVVIKAASTSEESLRRALSFRPQGIYVPMIEDRQSAEIVMGAIRSFVVGDSASTSASDADEEPVVVLMIESLKGLHNAEEICGVPGVDGVALGIFDLAQDLGVGRDVNHPEMHEAYDRVLAAASRFGVRAGVGGPGMSPEQFGHWASRGSSLSLAFIDMLSVRDGLSNTGLLRSE